MKSQNITNPISHLPAFIFVLSLYTINISAQGIVVNENNATYFKVPYERFDSITKYGYDDSQEDISEHGLMLHYANGSTYIIPFNNLDSISTYDYKDAFDIPEYHEYVDLGLPSGTCWATCNLGANYPEDYGDYFAWGETEPYYEQGYAQFSSPVWKPEKSAGYSWSSYKYSKGSSNTITKYSHECGSEFCYNGYYDGKTSLDPEDDAAYVNWGGNWRMPTIDDFKELINKCSWTWTTVNGTNGYKIVSNNGNSIFLPAAGYRKKDILYNIGSDGYYYTNMMRNGCFPYNVEYLYFCSNTYTITGFDRFFGQSVRPVLRKE